ncbi:Golgi reassembly-stacking protein 2 [Hondaea fermentalgiana]|uniref:Golgi reassembly-stacking protein 2 n=1 Tax=Hondaea fermentalgiana TaxID=2315210 RepID=A0A2R5GN94_9STRA|nr:Golgi reassembly-stacking protein 2 [Hondaea fermentalgiana]|eukprot:GBG29771.1 Golgi reassembly-stacking protein 2 [Hondaea fermentalgiana]
MTGSNESEQSKLEPEQQPQSEQQQQPKEQQTGEQPKQQDKAAEVQEAIKTKQKTPEHAAAAAPTGSNARTLISNRCGAPERIVELLYRRAHAYRVLLISPGSPLGKSGLVPWFDFIVRAGEVDLVAVDVVEWNEESFQRLVVASEGQPLRLTVYNCKNRSLREVVFTPSKRWGRRNDLAGVRLSYDTYTDCMRDVVRVMDIQGGSPALRSGLQSHSDFILGTIYGQPFRSSAALVATVRRALDKHLNLFVYSSVADTVRIVQVKPTSLWSGEGLLGCDIGLGQSHMIPNDVRDTLGTYRPVSMASLSMSLAKDDSDIVETVEDYFRSERGTHARWVRHEVSTQAGYGEILGEDDKGGVVLELDWKLANNAVVLCKCSRGNFERLPTLDDDQDS